MIDSPLPPPQLLVMPVRPDPVPPGQATVRPSPSPNGAEAGARHPLTDHQRDDTKVASREQAKVQDGADPTYDRPSLQGEGTQATPHQIGAELDVFA